MSAEAILCQLKTGARVSAFAVNGVSLGVIVINPGEAPRLCRFDGTSEALPVLPDGRIILPLIVPPGSSVSIGVSDDVYEIKSFESHRLIEGSRAVH